MHKTCRPIKPTIFPRRSPILNSLVNGPDVSGVIGLGVPCCQNLRLWIKLLTYLELLRILTAVLDEALRLEVFDDKSEGEIKLVFFSRFWPFQIWKAISKTSWNKSAGPCTNCSPVVISSSSKPSIFSTSFVQYETAKSLSWRRSSCSERLSSSASLKGFAQSSSIKDFTIPKRLAAFQDAIFVILPRTRAARPAKGDRATRSACSAKVGQRKCILIWSSGPRSALWFQLGIKSDLRCRISDIFMPPPR